MVQKSEAALQLLRCTDTGDVATAKKLVKGFPDVLIAFETLPLSDGKSLAATAGDKNQPKLSAFFAKAMAAAVKQARKAEKKKLQRTNAPAPVEVGVVLDLFAAPTTTCAAVPPAAIAGSAGFGTAADADAEEETFDGFDE